MKKLLLFLLALGAPAFAGFASLPDSAFSKSAIGTTGANFLTIPVGARAIAMGNAYSALANDVTAIAWNPAGLAQLGTQEITASHNALLESSYSEFVAYALPVKPGRTIALSMLYASQGTLQALNELGQDTGSFTPNDLAVTAAYGHDFEKFMVGGSVKYIRSTIDQFSGSAAAFDFGVLVPHLQEDKLSVAVVVQNLGTDIKLDTQADPLPLVARAGVCVKLSSYWLGTFEAALPVDNEPQYALGTEFSWPFTEKTKAAVRGGFNSRTKDLEGLKYVTTGAGISWPFLSVDYAWMPVGNLGSTHRFSLGAKF